MQSLIHDEMQKTKNMKEHLIKIIIFDIILDYIDYFIYILHLLICSSIFLRLSIFDRSSSVLSEKCTDYLLKVNDPANDWVQNFDASRTISHPGWAMFYSNIQCTGNLIAGGNVTW